MNSFEEDYIPIVDDGKGTGDTKDRQEAAKERLREYRRELLDILQTRNAGMAITNMDVALASWQEQQSDAVEWLADNNNRINLYQILGIRDERWDGDSMDNERAAGLLSIKRVIISIKALAETDDATTSVGKLERTLHEHATERFICNAVIDTLARTGRQGGDTLLGLMYDTELSDALHVRIALSLLRYSHVGEDHKQQAVEILKRVAASEDPLVLISVIELAGLIGGDEGRIALGTIREKIKDWSAEKRIWVERDLISTQLTIDPSYQDRVVNDLHGKAWVSKAGIVFGALVPGNDFEAFVELHSERLEKMAEALVRINDAFGKEPVMYVDLIMEGKEGDGWTQNSVYASAEIVGHPFVTDTTNIQGIGHEACERWESKGFVDAEMERQYIQMMGDTYDGSVLDKFRLQHRIDILTQAGHPWDGSREYMAELGSMLLVDPEAANRLFNPEKNSIALDALESFAKKLEKFRART